ncbi:hypothetical protein C2E23DRAFT_739683 [Lenzites betulinus]|nr:hypothetical protein C2E23DRAFT_739683 [Lenzites betulinus]
MTSGVIKTSQQLDHALRYWKSFTFNDWYIKLKDAVDSLATEKPIAEPRMEYSARWMVRQSRFCLDVPDAIFHTAAVWVWGSNLETGNFVPRGETAPSTGKLSESRMQDTANNMCQFSYAVDTSNDKTLYEAQKAFEKQICKTDGFNRTQKPRRKWQEGEGSYDATYIFVAQMFVRRGFYTWKKELTLVYELHPWIREATAQGKQFFANPDRPEVFKVVDGQLRPISECTPPGLLYGDLLWISFVVEFIVSSNAWNPNFIPVEIVRVGRVSPDLVLAKSSPGADAESESNDVALPTRRQRLQAGQSAAVVGMIHQEPANGVRRDTK